MDKILKPLNFNVSAPGKVILHGEHSVVYGKPALAGVIDRRNYFHIKDYSSLLNIQLHFQALNLQTEIPIEDIKKLICDLKASDSSDFTSAIGIVSDYVKKLYPYAAENDERKSNPLKAFLYLLCGIFIEKGVSDLKNGFEAKLKSHLKIGAGLGSSASFGVCLAAAFLILSRKHSAEEFSNIYELDDNDKHFISKWAFMSEKLMHGTPSGVDNTVCTFGNIVKFTKGQEPIPITLKSQIPIFLVDTKVPRSTAKLVASVKELKDTFPEVVNKILDAMEELVNEAIPLYESFDRENKADYKKIEQLFTINNNLLRAIGVSHERLEKVFEIAYKNGFSCKLTGAGGGGFALIPLSLDYSSADGVEKEGSLCNTLIKNNFDLWETKIGGPGVQVEEEK